MCAPRAIVRTHTNLGIKFRTPKFVQFEGCMGLHVEIFFHCNYYPRDAFNLGLMSVCFVTRAHCCACVCTGKHAMCVCVCVIKGSNIVKAADCTDVQ